MKFLLCCAALLFAAPALAQQPTMQQQLDSGVAGVTGIISQMRGQILSDMATIKQLQDQIDALQKQLTAAKAPAESAK